MAQRPGPLQCQAWCGKCQTMHDHIEKMHDHEELELREEPTRIGELMRNEVSESSCKVYSVPYAGIDLDVFPSKAPDGKPQPYAQVFVMREEEHNGKILLVRQAPGQPGEICSTSHLFSDKVRVISRQDAGCHTNFSRKSMREKGDLDVRIKVGEAFEKVAAPILDEVDARERWL